jgi:hypothetical protein
MCFKLLGIKDFNTTELIKMTTPEDERTTEKCFIVVLVKNVLMLN